MSYSTDQLTAIRDLPDFLRTEHCYNDLQHAMLVILFRHGLLALQQGKDKMADRYIDNISLYLYIHFLNEEEGLAYKVTNSLLNRESLQDHSEFHVRFLDHWRDKILIPYKRQDIDMAETIKELSSYYNLLIKHIDAVDIPTYGQDSIPVEHTRSELARIAQTRMPMSPFMAGAYSAVQAMDPMVAGALNKSQLSPCALKPLETLNLVPNVGRILTGKTGSLRDRFASITQADRSSIFGTANSGSLVYAA
ncbi:hypothetical protein [Magnetovibrio sp.]|uniref:hypothetical protein n=1 Tax=Magnetovibrio sp. TaxID=2024836 RepID=UPI002F94AA2B